MIRTRISLRSLLAVLFCVACFARPAGAQTPGTNQWTWLGGSSTVSGQSGVWPGVYGTKGVPAPANIPPTRLYEATWTGKDGRFWLFGGSNLTTGLSYFNDLWAFDPGSEEWTWFAGDTTAGSHCEVVSRVANCGQPGIYGTLGAAAPANSPGAREYAQSWTDANGNLWLYGGLGFDGAGNLVALNDLWKFDTYSSEWAWMAGQSAVPLEFGCGGCVSGIPSVPGTQGTAASANTPGSLYLGTGWTDLNGNFWLFGGFGYAPASEGGYAGVPNDLWEFNRSTGEWTWEGGDPNFGVFGGVAGTYGTLGMPARGNFPGTRWADSTWVDESGNLWLFGGQGFDSTGSAEGVLNDLWEYDPGSGEWTWMGGSSTFNCANSPQQYCHEPGVYGTLGQPSTGNIPGSRYLASSWRDSSGNFWLFGGEGFDSNSDWGYLNDQWEFDLATNEWTWIGGSDNISAGSVAGIYGTLGVPAAANEPGARNAAASWTDKDGNFWLWGGAGIDAAGVYGYENDLWRYQPASAVPPITAAMPQFSPAPGTYATAQSVTISDTTAGATIYYTTDGTTPTAMSAQYTGPIDVAATETVEAMATAPYAIGSAIASATYTIPQGFTFTLNPTSLTVKRGGSATTNITVQDDGGFNSNIGFSCSGLPPGATCNFTLGTVPTSAGVSITTLTVSVAADSASRPSNGAPLIPGRVVNPGSILAAIACFFGWKKRRRMQVLLLAFCVAALGASNGCAIPHIKPGISISTISVTGVSGSLSHSTSFTLTVK